MASEFYSLTIGTTDSVPLDFAGARQVVIRASGDDVRIASQVGDLVATGNFYLISSASSTPLVVTANDAALYARSVAGPAILYVWVVR